jgi:hypothetical protein
MECSICLFSCTHDHKTLLCSHSFHYECINTWFKKGDQTCPLCRSYGGYTHLTELDDVLFDQNTLSWMMNYGFELDFIEFMIRYHPETHYRWIDTHRWKEHNIKYGFFERKLANQEVDLQLMMSYVWRDFGEARRSV